MTDLVSLLQTSIAHDCQWTLLSLGKFERQEIFAPGFQGDGLPRLRRSKKISHRLWLTPVINHSSPIDREASTPCADQAKSVVPCLLGSKAAGGTKRELHTRTLVTSSRCPTLSSVSA
jgi:hypothetical protein